VILFTIFCQTLYLQSHVSFVCEKNFFRVLAREFTFEVVLDGLKYEEDLKKEHLPELFVRSCLTWIIIIIIVTIIMIIMIMITKPKSNITN